MLHLVMSFSGNSARADRPNLRSKGSPKAANLVKIVRHHAPAVPVANAPERKR